MDDLGVRPARFAGLSDVERVEAQWRTDDPALLADSPFYQLLRAAERDPQRLAIRFLPDPTEAAAARDVTFGEFHSLLLRGANVLHELGARPDRAIAFLLTNTPEALALIWGGTAAGIVAPLNHYLEPDLLGAMMARIQADIVVTDARPGGDLPWEKVTAAVARSGCVRKVLHVGDAGVPATDGVEVVGWAEAHRRAPWDSLVSGRLIAGSDIAAYFHTGGTTGLPKFARQLHGAQALAAKVTGFGMGVDRSHRLMAGMPIFHAGGLMGCGLTPLAHGASIVQPTALGYRGAGVIAGLWRLCARHSVTMLVGPPTVYARLCEFPRDELHGDVLRCAVSSAAALPDEIQRRFERHAKIPLREVYGLTEATLLVAGTPYDAPTRVGSVGVRLPCVELRTCEPGASGKDRRPTAPGKVGVVAVRSPMVMPGYFGEQAATTDGWLDTGDLGRIDEHGYLYLTGRAKDMIIRGGHNIDPSIIEEALATHPAVAVCAAVGMPDADAGEIPVAYAMLRPGVTAAQEELLNFVRASIQERAAVPRIVLILDQLPTTAVGKISKVELRKDAARLAAAAALDPLAAEVRSMRVVDAEAGGIRVVVETSEDSQALRRGLQARLGPLNLKWQIVVATGETAA